MRARRRRALPVPEVSRIRSGRLAPAASSVILEDAAYCYDEHGKSEGIGVLLGRVVNGVARIEQAVLYDTPRRNRTWVDPHPDAFRRRVLALERRTHRQYLGTYHSHPEIGGCTSRGASPEDDAIFLADRRAVVDIIVDVWNAGRSPAPSRTSLAFYDGRYAYRCYLRARRDGGVRRIPLRELE